MKNSFKKRFLVLLIAMILTFSFAPTQRAYAGGVASALFAMTNFFSGDLFAMIQTNIDIFLPSILGYKPCDLTDFPSLGALLCPTGSDSPLPIITPRAGDSECQLAISLTFYIPSFNVEPALYGNWNGTLPGTPIDETHNQIAIYRFSLPDTLSHESLAVSLIANPGGNYGNGGGFTDQFGSGWAGGDSGSYYFTSPQPKSDSRIAVLDYSEYCKGNVCKFLDNTPPPDNVPPNSYIVYVAKILGSYTFPVDETVLTDFGFMQVPFPSTRPNKFLTTKESAALAMLPSHYEHSPYDSWSFGDAYLGPFQTGVPVCPGGVCGSANGKTYAYSDTSYGSDTQCSSGTSINSTFPSAGSSFSWICVGENGGTSSGICSASRTSITNGLTLSADPNPVNYNSASTLSWTTQDAVGCWGYSETETGKTWPGGDNYQAISSNVFTENLIADQTYNMDCWNSAGTTVTQSVTVNVNCNSNCNDSSNYCQGATYSGNCRQTCTGTTPPSCGPWGACNKSCGGGTQTKSCVCPNGTETLACNSQPCPPGYREVTPW